MAGIGNTFIIFSEKSPEAGLFWENEVKVIPNTNINMVNRLFNYRKNRQNQLKNSILQKKHVFL